VEAVSEVNATLGRQATVGETSEAAVAMEGRDSVVAIAVEVGGVITLEAAIAVAA